MVDKDSEFGPAGVGWASYQEFLKFQDEHKELLARVLVLETKKDSNDLWKSLALIAISALITLCGSWAVAMHNMVDKDMLAQLISDKVQIGMSKTNYDVGVLTSRVDALSGEINSLRTAMYGPGGKDERDMKAGH